MNNSTKGRCSKKKNKTGGGGVVVLPDVVGRYLRPNLQYLRWVSQFSLPTEFDSVATIIVVKENYKNGKKN